MTSESGIPTAVLEAECQRLLNFGRHFPHPLGGAAWLDATGQPDMSPPVYTWITARMVHVYVLGHLLGGSGDLELAAQALAGLTGRLRDPSSGGWLSRVGTAAERADATAGYTQHFV